MADYVKNSDLLREICVSKEQGKLTPEALRMLQKMAKECTKMLRYKDEEDKFDCLQSAMLDILKYWNRFDPTKSSNAFSYFTQVAKNGLCKGWKQLYPINSIKMSRITTDDSGDGIYNL